MVQATAQPPAGGQFGQPDQPVAPDLSWMDKTVGWGIRARPDFERGGGLTLRALNIGVYAKIPDHIPFRNRWPRGAYPSPVAGSIGGYYLQDKWEQWAECAPDIYEEAISRRWSTATDVPWETGHGLPDDVEIAVCQLATELSQQASIESETVCSWLQNLSPGYHEVKVYLATAVYDAARMFEGYRKRAMLNGGGMLLESPGMMNRAIMETFSGWTQTVLSMWFIRNCLQVTILRYLAAYGPTEADRVLAWRLIPDKMRTAAYAVDHIRFAIAERPEQRMAFHTWLAQVEAAQQRDARDPVMWEALAVIFGGGVEKMDEGMQVVKRLQRDWIRMYLQRCKAAGVERGDQLLPGLRMLLGEEEQAAA